MVAIALLLALIAAPAEAQTTETRSISVEGTSSRQVANDTARFTSAVTARRKTAADALDAAARATRRLLASLADVGVARADTRTTSVSVRRSSSAIAALGGFASSATAPAAACEQPCAMCPTSARRSTP